jgi:hypothetical protein
MFELGSSAVQERGFRKEKDIRRKTMQEFMVQEVGDMVKQEILLIRKQKWIRFII